MHESEVLQKRIASALEEGLVLVDASGKIIWMNHEARQRINGELRHLDLPLPKPDAGTLECFVAPADIMLKGQRVTIGVIQETVAPRENPDLMASIESVLADSTSWFTRTVLEKLKAISSAPAGNERPPGAVASAVALQSLSAREREVLGLICEGRSDAQMATLLGLSENTVRNHIASLYRKIGVNRRTAAVIWARERGIKGCEGLGLDPHRRRKANANGSALPY